MNKINPPKALYIKLGEKGRYEQECLASPGSLRVGWRRIDHALCLAGSWEAVKKSCQEVYGGKGHAATSRMNQLRLFYDSGEDVLWITFYQGHLYWCFAKNEIVLQPDKSKNRPTIQGWSNCDIKDNPLDASHLSGGLLAMQCFRGVICQVKEFEYLIRKINCESSLVEQNAKAARAVLIQSLVAIIQNLHWKEFELLTDLIFRQAGWQRLGVLGETTKDIDLDLLSPIDQKHYRVQVKSAAGKKEFQSFLSLAANETEDTHYYFVVHQPDASLVKEADNPLVRVWLPDDIARLAVNYGLVDWLIGKAK